MNLDASDRAATVDLLVEITSPNNNKHDAQTKFNLYQKIGVKEYWITERNDKMLLVYTLIDQDFVALKPNVEGEKINSTLFSEFDFAL
jgi:Uma2 family endonuclease